MAASSELGLEGLVAKTQGGRYEAGRRSRSWIKIKHRRSQEAVIGGWRPGNGRRRDTVGSLLLGIPDGDELIYIGRVGSGFRDADLDDLRARMEAIDSSENSFTGIPAADGRGAR